MNNADINTILGAIGAITGILGLLVRRLGLAITGAMGPAAAITAFLLGTIAGIAGTLWISRRLRPPP